MKLIIPMAGRGTRVRPHSHVTPKPLLKVRGKNMVERIVDTFTRVLPRPLDAAAFVLGPDFGEEVREQLRAVCRPRGIDAHFPVQHEALGTAHAVLAAGDQLSGEGIVVFADTLFDMDGSVDLGEADVIAWVKHVEDPSRFGVAVREGDRIVEFVEKPRTLISNEALIGIYYVKDLAVLRGTIERLIEDDVRGHGGEFQLTDAFDRMLKAGYRFTTASVTEWLDCGTIPALMETTKVYLDKEAGEPSPGTAEHCVIHEPVYLGPGATVRNSVIGPYVSVEAGARIEHAVVRDSIVFAEAHVVNAVLADSLVGQHAHVHGQAQVVNIGDHSVLGPRG
ncbi:MAG: glucose-1-phosphate thymidylyltransferase [Bacteroidetes bacterium]|nr:MAG: glucose-1-phosphate thymidylyltransferase [Bacteroidota bacterium]